MNIFYFTYIESFHNQLKTIHLQRRRNRRLDGLIHLLVTKVEKSYKNRIGNEERGVGRMSKGAKVYLRDKAKAAIYSEEEIQLMITLETDGSFTVASFSSDDVFYKVVLSFI